MILHNIIISVEERSGRLDSEDLMGFCADGIEREEGNDDEGDGPGIGDQSSYNSPGQLFRDKVMSSLFDSADSPCLRHS